MAVAVLRCVGSPQIFGLLLKYMKPTRPASDRLMAIGAVAEVSAQLKQLAAAYIPHMLPILAAGLKDENSSVKRNSAYCSGVFCLHCPEQMAPFTLQVLQGLQPLLSDEEEDACRDNALGAISRIIRGNAAAVPTAELVGLLAQNMPLTGDEDENAELVSCFLHVYRIMPAALNPFLGTIVAAFVALLADPEKAKCLGEDARKAEMVAFISHLAREFAGPMQGVFASCPAAHQQWVAANISC